MCSSGLLSSGPAGPEVVGGGMHACVPTETAPRASWRREAAIWYGPHHVPQQLTVFPYVLQLVRLMYTGMSAAIMGREGAWWGRVACVFAYGGASAVAAWGLSLLVAVWCCLLPCMCAHAHGGHAVPAKGCMHVAVCSWLCTPDTSPGVHFTHTQHLGMHAYLQVYT